MKWEHPFIISADPHTNFVRKIVRHCDMSQLLHWQMVIFEEIFFLILVQWIKVQKLDYFSFSKQVLQKKHKSTPGDIYITRAQST